jgi:hypothetical protein
VRPAGRTLAGVALTTAAIVACGGAPAAQTSPTPTLIAEPTAATPPASGTPFHLATPGPTVPAGHWRWLGSVIDQDSKPLAGVCVHIGPGDCQFNSVRSDDQGKFVIDFPQVDVQYDFHFVKDGYQKVDVSIRTQGPGSLPVRMIPNAK